MEVFEEKYRGKKGFFYHHAKHAVPEEAYLWVSNKRTKKIGSFVKKEDTILEYGVGTGWNICQIDCRRKFGFDIAEHLKPFLEGRGINFVDNIKDIKDNSIDVVVCHHVLEHLSSPVQALYAIRKVLSSNNGKLLLFIPVEKGKRYNRGDVNQHLYSWNIQTICNLLNNCGYEILKYDIAKFGYDRFCSVAAHNYHIGEFGYNFLHTFCHMINPHYEIKIVAQILLDRKSL